MTSNETRRTVEISNFIISGSLSFNISQKPRFKEVMDLEINVSKFYQPKNRSLIPKDLMGVICDQNMESNLSLIKKRFRYFWIVTSRLWCHYLQNSTVEHISFREKSSSRCIRTCWFPGSFSRWWGKHGTFICTIFIENIWKFYLRKTITDVFMFNGASNVQLVGEPLKINYPNLTVMRGF